jgi:hypothetical protein
MKIKGEFEEARALAVAMRLVRVSSLPPSAAHLLLPQQLPQSKTEYWQLVWSDTRQRHAKTGLIRCVLFT